MFQCDCPPGDCPGLVRAYQDGDRAAGDALACKFRPLVFSIVQKVLGPSRREDWEDAAQTIFLRLFAGIDKWEQRCPFCKWLAVVAARRAIDLSRLPDPLARLPGDDVADPRTESKTDPPDAETIERIERVVAGFPIEWRKVWEGFVQGVRREELARRAGKSVRTIQYWLAEMVDQIREAVGEQ
jgi:RNA polymerase sigma factor (sigma-70 family)